MSASNLMSSPGRVSIFMGKGGVGKSTATALAAKRHIEQGRNVIALSLDPSHALKTYLADLEEHPNLEVICFDGAEAARKALEVGGRIIAEIVAAGTYFEADHLEELFSESWPGADEWLGYWSLSALLAGTADQILIDLAPGPHARQFLAAPAQISAWLDLLDALLERQRYLSERLGNPHSGAEDPMQTFLVSLQQHLASLEATMALEARVVLIATDDPASLEEALILGELARDNGLVTQTLILNRIDASVELRHRLPSSLRTLVSKIERWPLEPKLARPSTNPLGLIHQEDLNLIDFQDVDPGDKILHLFTGKGGVGKTTLSLATAGRLAADNPERRIAWISLDPENPPANVPRGIDVLMIDAGKEVDQVIDELHDEWRRALEGPANLDTPFERRAIDAILGLRPPGFDLLAPALAIGERLLDKACDTWVIDAPATGHLLRLWTALEEGDRWLSASLRILDHRRSLVSMPRMTRRLLRWRRALRRLHEIASDPGRGCTWIVTDGSAPGLDQAKQLRQAAAEHGWALGPILLNSYLTSKARTDEPRQRTPIMS